jgi:hypothetical protein
MGFDGMHTDEKLISNGPAGVSGSGNLGIAFSRVGPAKSGTSPLTPPTGRILKKRRKLEGPVGETGFPARTGLYDLPNLLIQIPFIN